MQTLLRKSRNRNTLTTNIRHLNLPSCVKYDGRTAVSFYANRVLSFAFYVMTYTEQDYDVIRALIRRYFYHINKKIVIVERGKGRNGKYVTRIEVYLTTDKLPTKNEMEKHISNIVDMFDDTIDG